ncbi:hypothetical protein BGW39_008685 [Mortierella sp. 14UC]|nr:hypothetical protein BGW39_008685 [Mortierella sp. 14UC]
MSSTPQLPLEIWFQILSQTLNLLLPTATTPRLYSTHILPLLLTSHTFHEHCHPITAPHLRKHKLLQLFTRWKAAHSREVHFYHHPLRTHVRYALPDRVGNPPGEEYETLYSFIKRAYLFGCESVCGTVIPVEGGLEGPPAVPAAAAVAAPGAVPPTQNGDTQAAIPATGTNPTPASATTGTGATSVPGNLVIAPPPAPMAPPAPTHHGGDGGGQGWKGHALQWHVANPTFAAEGTLELYRDVVEEYRRIICGSPASRERAREMELIMDRIRNPHRYAAAAADSIPGLSDLSQQSAMDQQAEMEDLDQIKDIAEEYEDMEENTDEDEDGEDDDLYMIGRDEGEFLSEIEAKGGLRRRDSGHGQSSSDMDIDNDLDEDDEENDDENMMGLYQQEQEHHRYRHSTGNSEKLEGGSSNGVSRSSSKREPETMSMDYQLEGASRHRRGLRNRKMERSYSAGEQERLIMDMALGKPYHAMGSLSPFHPIDSKAQLPPTASGCSSSSSSSTPSPSSSSPPMSALGYTRSGSPAPFTPLAPSTRKSRDAAGYTRSKSSRNALQRSHSSPGTSTAGVRIPSNSSRSHLGTGPLDTPSVSPLENTTNVSSPPSPATPTSTLSPPLSSSPSQGQQLPRPLRAEDLDFDLASACANTFASDLAFVLARVPGLGAHFHRFEQLAKLKLHVGWAKHAQSRGGNDVFVMSCSRLIGLLAPLANTPLVSERGG